MVTEKKGKHDVLLAVFEEWHQEAKMYAELSKVSKEYSSKVSKMNADLHKEKQKMANRGEKMTDESLWKMLGHDKQLKRLRKEANDVMKAIKKKYALIP